MKNHKLNGEIIDAVLQPRLELTGFQQCVVDGLKSIIEYTDSKIKIDLGKYCVVFIGDGLYIDSFSYEGAIIQGTIVSLGFEGND